MVGSVSDCTQLCGGRVFTVPDVFSCALRFSALGRANIFAPARRLFREHARPCPGLRWPCALLRPRAAHAKLEIRGEKLAAFCDRCELHTAHPRCTTSNPVNLPGSLYAGVARVVSSLPETAFASEMQGCHQMPDASIVLLCVTLLSVRSSSTRHTG